MQKILASFFISISEFSKLFDNKKRLSILKNLVELDGIGGTQTDAIENFFSNKINTKITYNLINQLIIKNYSQTNKDGKFSNKNYVLQEDFRI